MRLRIGQRQRRAPGAAHHHPALEAELFADRLHVRDQVRQRVVLAAALGAAAAGAALVEQHGMKTLGIEQPAMIGLAAAPGSAMQVDRGNAALAADALDIDLVAAVDGKVFGGQRCKGIAARRCASTSGAMATFRLRRSAGEVAIEERFLAGRGVRSA